MDLLREAVGMGYRDHESCRTESVLDPLRDREDFRLLMMDLAMPADPFARRLDADFRPVPEQLIATAPADKP